MGANFAPSYANLAMGFWENKYIHDHNPFAANIIFFGRYIDDLIIIWDGDTELVASFVKHCNDNPYGLSFTSVMDPSTIAFLDLELGHDGPIITSKNYTKPTAGNSYLHFKSCHFPKWITNIPKGQFCRLRQNCTKDSDYIELSTDLKRKFLDKQYPESLVEEAYEYYLHGKPQKNSQPLKGCSSRFVSTFHNKYKNMEKILHKH